MAFCSTTFAISAFLAGRMKGEGRRTSLPLRAGSREVCQVMICMPREYVERDGLKPKRFRKEKRHIS